MSTRPWASPGRCPLRSAASRSARSWRLTEPGCLMDLVVAAAVAGAHRTEWGFVLAAAARLTGDLDEAGECAQDACAQALTAWATSGVPARPGAWLTMVARRPPVDLLRPRGILP